MDYHVNECPVCKGTVITTIGGTKKLYGLVELNADGTRSELPTYLPLVANICQQCGHIEFRHCPPNKLSND